MGGSLPYRVDFFDDEVGGLRNFDQENQRTLTQVERIELLNENELKLDKEDIESFRKSYGESFDGRNEKE